MHLANVVTEIEDISGSKAKEDSRQLMKRNYGTTIAIAISLVLFFCSTPFFALAQNLVAIDSNIGLATKIVYGITSMVLNPLIIIYCWVVPTMLYFVCETYHGESIDISSSNDCLNGDYVALESEGEKIDQLDI
ncbi:uncharacterized protein LOC141600651 [Silene latifolia]|uniref:uncharacterized protein LOC141600651 n=1 Tax=Silene latifolia TaxID=37657 RepID=UPI003D774F95